MDVERRLKEHCNKQQEGVKFHRNKKYFSLLREVKEGYWVNDEPLFINKTQGLYPVFKNGGPQGRFPKNHQEFILRNLVQEKEEFNI